jgi:DNA-binding IclR family transcriptional regulator
MKRLQLDESEQKVLTTLAQYGGAMSPSRVAAEAWMMPGETLTVLKTLSNAGFVVMRDDRNSPDGLVVVISQEARTYLSNNLT